MSETPQSLSEIPIINIENNWPLKSLELHPERANALLDNASDRYPDFVLKFGDSISKKWLQNNNNPYLEEITQVATKLERPGAYFLNINYEWGCTCQAGLDPETQIPRLIRVLDWPDKGLGQNIIAAKIQNHLGSWVSLTWPGFTGVLQAVAKGRFAAALNQAPMDIPTGWYLLDWMINRVRVWNTSHIPPAHLLRKVFETAKTYKEAKDILTSTPIAAPTIYVLTGMKPDEACVIERRQEEAFILEGPVCAANSWQNTNWKGCFRGEENAERIKMMTKQPGGNIQDFSWLKPPVLNTRTRLAMVTDAQSGQVMAQGYEADGPATKILKL